MQWSGYAFPSVGPQLGEEFKNLNDQGVYEYLGGDPRISTNWRLVRGTLTAQPSTVGWGTAQAGARWFNSVDIQGYLWDGTQIVIDA